MIPVVIYPVAFFLKIKLQNIVFRSVNAMKQMFEVIYMFASQFIPSTGASNQRDTKNSMKKPSNHRSLAYGKRKVLYEFTMKSFMIKVLV